MCNDQSAAFTLEAISADAKMINFGKPKATESEFFANSKTASKSPSCCKNIQLRFEISTHS